MIFTESKTCKSHKLCNICRDTTNPVRLNILKDFEIPEEFFECPDDVPWDCGKNGTCPDTVSKVKSFVKTITSTKVERNEYERRLNICKTCPKQKVVNDKLYCSSCGCGQNPLAELTTKLWWSLTTCPLRKFGMFDRLKGIASLDEMKALVTLAKKAIESGLVPIHTASPQEPKTVIDWNNAKPDFTLKMVLTPDDLRTASQKMTEYIVNEKWNEGFMFAIQILLMLRP